MAEGIVYLDVDDEITSAASRIRSAAGTRVALVVPYGSRIATSRMNFRLLSREAVMNNRRLSIVSGDAAARSLAASAGLPVFATVNEYESTGTGSAADVAADRGLAASETVVAPASPGPSAPPAPDMGARPGKRGLVDDDTTALEVGPSVAATGSAGAVVAGAGGASVAGPVPGARRAEQERAEWERPDWERPAPPARPDPEDSDGDDAAGFGVANLPPLLGRRIRGSTIAVLGLLVLALIATGVGAYVFLPSASITLVPRRDPIGPLEIDVSADPEVTTVDPDAGVVPAVRLEIPVEAADTFTTTGKHVEETSARGSVTFTNYDTSSGVTIPSGSIVSTEGGVRFRTLAAAVLQPAAIFPTFAPSSDSVRVGAVRTGEAGNVPANTIRVVPQGQNPDLLKVNNPADTSGGTHKETPEVTAAEVDAAIATLQAQLAEAFDSAVASGAGAPPDTTLFPETKTLGGATPAVDPESLVGQAVETFDLKLTASGTVIAVDPRPVDTIARAELQKHVDPDHRLIEDSVVVDVGEGSVGEDGGVTFQATVRASQVLTVDPTTLPALVKGKTKTEAEAALARFGTVTVSLWPDWATTVTAVDGRLTIAVDEAADGDGSAASPSPASGGPKPTATPRRTASPSPAGSPVGPSASALGSAAP